jgi:hypothetical protein
MKLFLCAIRRSSFICLHHTRTMINDFAYLLQVVKLVSLALAQVIGSTQITGRLSQNSTKSLYIPDNSLASMIL